ncbi:hypothetical protein MASR2M18_12450 [Ignavibacteria bacterium]|jgi:hypothetical protein|nr:hypothetical protein [Bacteroidota bacterium]MCZ2132403.1 hypothetical protein [Bacteroidota bacterium]
MKILLTFAIAALLLGTMPAMAQNAAPNVIKENLKVEFPTLWNAIKKTLADIKCDVEVEKNDQGEDNLFKGNIRTGFFIIITGIDSTKDVMESYSCEDDACEKFPYIRGGEWVSGRIQYKFVLKEKEDNTVDVRLEGELSGFEQWVTHKVHFWQSNGVLEHRLLDKIKENAGITADK